MCSIKCMYVEKNLVYFYIYHMAFLNVTKTTIIRCMYIRAHTSYQCTLLLCIVPMYCTYILYMYTDTILMYCTYVLYLCTALMYCTYILYLCTVLMYCTYILYLCLTSSYPQSHSSPRSTILLPQLWLYDS